MNGKRQKRMRQWWILRESLCNDTYTIVHWNQALLMVTIWTAILRNWKTDVDNSSTTPSDCEKEYPVWMAVHYFHFSSKLTCNHTLHVMWACVCVSVCLCIEDIAMMIVLISSVLWTMNGKIQLPFGRVAIMASLFISMCCECTLRSVHTTRYLCVCLCLHVALLCHIYSARF